MAILWLLFEYSGIVYKIMGILNLPRTSHVVMPMNSEARDMGVLNKQMLSTTIRFFKSNIRVRCVEGSIYP